MQNVDEVLVFDIWGDYGRFRRGYTSTSTLTYPFPTRTALAGMVSAMLGLPRDSYYELFAEENSAFALQILNPIKKIRITQNLIDTKYGRTPWEIQRKKQPPRTQVPFEFLKDSRYRIYIWMEEKFKGLIGMIKEHKSFYTPYLGISECIANFEYIGIYDVEPKNTDGDAVKISSTIKNSENITIELEKGKKYGKIRIPGFMNNKRIVKGFLGMIYEEDGETIKICKGEYYKVKGLKKEGENVNIIFF
ncbi:MAG: type I-B CRISPR-associated protein Cas5 [Candidatus Cloacimonas sp. 4484_209]|nr:MAG: type I-B CRISPR-associated protein Cas5 [Candidatus Cloacimonas sp. 4484_209]